MERGGGLYFMRHLSVIERDIKRVSDLLNQLILERKMTILCIQDIEISSREITEKAMAKMKDDKQWVDYD
jgi:hypothetical protein